MVVFWWMRWRDVGCGTLSSPHERHIGFDSSYDTVRRAFVLEREFFAFGSLVFFSEHYKMSDGKHSDNNKTSCSENYI